MPANCPSYAAHGLHHAQAGCELRHPGISIEQREWLQGAELIFYGDSITWCFTGENPSGIVTAADRERSAVFQRHFGRYHSKIMAIPGTKATIS